MGGLYVQNSNTRIAMSSNKQTYVLDPAEISIRDWSWSIEQIEAASAKQLTSHYEEFKLKKQPIIRILGSARLYQYDIDAYLSLPEDSELRHILEMRTWFPANPEEFFDWCHDYEWSVRRRISFLEKRKHAERVGRRKGIERHPNKWAPKKRRSTNKGKPKMVSQRNYDRLQRKWEKEILDNAMNSGRICSRYWHPNFVLRLEAESILSNIRREQKAHDEKVKQRKVAQDLLTKQRIAELRAA